MKREPTTAFGRRGELAVAALLRKRGYSVKKMPRVWPYDLLVNGRTRVEVKTSRLRKGRRWAASCRQSNEKAHYYIVRLLNVPGHRGAVHLLFRSPIKATGFGFSNSNLTKRHRDNFLAFEKRFSDRNNPDALPREGRFALRPYSIAWHIAMKRNSKWSRAQRLIYPRYPAY